MYNNAARQALAQQGKEAFARIPRRDKRICQANEIASHEDSEFTKLTAFAKAHPVIWNDIYRGFLARPDDRFGDTLLMFCDSVKYGSIVLNS
jgi:hypothetical protein